MNNLLPKRQAFSKIKKFTSGKEHFPPQWPASIPLKITDVYFGCLSNLKLKLNDSLQ